MKIAVTGGTGLVGRFIVEAALAAGHEVTLLSRAAAPSGFFSAAPAHLPYDLAGDPPPLAGHDALIHAAFAHLPGRYRGGEGDDPDRFLRLNRDGSLRLFCAAKAQGVARAIFLSSRAVYGDYPPGTTLCEDMDVRPDTLYGAMKAEVEAALAALSGPGFVTASLRATGVYGPAGPGQTHKWAGLFADFAAQKPIAPRAATEVHGADLAQAALLLLVALPAIVSGRAFNVSDLLLDRQDLLAEVARITGRDLPLPARAGARSVNAMDCSRLAALGWRPGGWDILRATLPVLLPPG